LNTARSVTSVSVSLSNDDSGFFRWPGFLRSDDVDVICDASVVFAASAVQALAVVDVVVAGVVVVVVLESIL
jgi:hypothetical protein